MGAAQRRLAKVGLSVLCCLRFARMARVMIRSSWPCQFALWCPSFDLVQ